MIAMVNQATPSQSSDMTFAIVSKIIKANAEQTKMEIWKNLEVMRTKVTANAHTYAEIIVDDLKITLDAKFQVILDSVESTRSLLLLGTSTRRALPPPEN